MQRKYATRRAKQVSVGALHRRLSSHERSLPQRQHRDQRKEGVGFGSVQRMPARRREHASAAPCCHSELMMMLAWVFPAQEGLSSGAGSNIIMNKEDVWEYGVDDSGTLQAAFSTCWRWWGSAVLPVAEWTHAAAGVDGSNEVHYVNGEQVESTNCPGVLTSNDADFKIGARGGDGGHSSYFHGFIDDAMLFSGALSDDDVLSIFIGAGGDVACGVECRQATGIIESAILPSSLIGYWSLNGNPYDASGNDLHGVAINGEYSQGLWG
eukprot:SAG31_NODE_8302_length_1477_cov_118.462990_1_plen_266_part_10